MKRIEFLLSGAVIGGLAGLLLSPAVSFAEPAPCYADAPAVLPAPMEYGRAYTVRSSSIVYEDAPAAVTYQRTYTEPYAQATRVITTTEPTVVYEEPVVYTRTYDDYAPTAYIQFSYGDFCYPYRYAAPYGYYGYYGYGGYYGHHRYYRSYGYSPSRRYYRSGYHAPAFRSRSHSLSRFFGRSHFRPSRSRGISFGRRGSIGRRAGAFRGGFGRGHRGGGRGGFGFRRHR